jgi:hypothetical protein
VADALDRDPVERDGPGAAEPPAEADDLEAA